MLCYILHQIQLSAPSVSPHWSKLLDRRESQGAEILISSVSRKHGAEVFRLVLSRFEQRCAIVPICCTNSDMISVRKAWDSLVLDLS